MNNKPVVTVIVPVFNAEKYLKKCIDSILCQTIDNVQIICVNDGSTDESELILRNYEARDKRISIINKENGGLSSARNVALPFVLSDYVYFLDSDDWIDSNTLEVCVSKMDDDVDIVISGAEIEGDAGNDANRRRLEKYFSVNKCGKFDVNDDFIPSITVVAWGKLYRNSIIKKFNMVFPYGQMYEDVPFVTEYLVHSKKCFFVEEKLYHYLQRKNSLKRKYNFEDYIYNFLFLYRRLESYNLLQSHKKIISRRYWGTINSAYKEVRKEDYYNLKRLVEKISSFYDSQFFYDDLIKTIKNGGFENKFPKKS